MSSENAKFGEKSMDLANQFALWVEEHNHILAVWDINSSCFTLLQGKNTMLFPYLRQPFQIYLLS